MSRGSFENRFGGLQLVKSLNFRCLLVRIQLFPIIVLTHVHIAQLASFFGQIFVDVVRLHANVAPLVDQVMMASLLVLILKVHLVSFLDC